MNNVKSAAAMAFFAALPIAAFQLLAVVLEGKCSAASYAHLELTSERLHGTATAIAASGFMNTQMSVWQTNFLAQAGNVSIRMVHLPSAAAGFEAPSPPDPPLAPSTAACARDREQQLGRFSECSCTI